MGREEEAEPQCAPFPSPGPLSVRRSPSTGQMQVLCNVVNKWGSTIGLREKRGIGSDGEIKTPRTFCHTSAHLGQRSLRQLERHLWENERILLPCDTPRIHLPAQPEQERGQSR